MPSACALYVRARGMTLRRVRSGDLKRGRTRGTIKLTKVTEYTQYSIKKAGTEYMGQAKIA